MALTLGQGAQLVASTSFRARIRGAMVRAAEAVATEVKGSLSQPAWDKRRRLSTKILNAPDSLLDAFVAAVAADPGTALVWTAPVNISSSTNANPSVVTTAIAHGYTTGDVVEIAGHTTNTNAVGTWVVTVVTSTTFSIPQSANGAGGATGTAQKMETDANLAFTVSSVFSSIAGLETGE
jgi:hypothetical protein